VMIRLAGCDANCRWCDTPESRTTDDSKRMSAEEVLNRINAIDCRLVEVTGGEPLVQPAVFELLSKLCEQGLETLLETNGLNSIEGVDPRAGIILDMKCPSSTVHERTCWENFNILDANDEVKCVIADRSDYEYARDKVIQMKLASKCTVTFSPVHKLLESSRLARWILDDNLDIRLGLQMHKIIWPGGEPVD